MCPRVARQRGLRLRVMFGFSTPVQVPRFSIRGESGAGDHDSGAGRVSWLQMAIGTLVGMMWARLLAPEQARTVLNMIGQAFQKLIGAG
jgi:hypothetical protein